MQTRDIGQKTTRLKKGPHFQVPVGYEKEQYQERQHSCLWIREELCRSEITFILYGSWVDITLVSVWTFLGDHGIAVEGGPFQKP